RGASGRGERVLEARAAPIELVTRGGDERKAMCGAGFDVCGDGTRVERARAQRVEQRAARMRAENEQPRGHDLPLYYPLAGDAFDIDARRPRAPGRSRRRALDRDSVER